MNHKNNRRPRKAGGGFISNETRQRASRCRLQDFLYFTEQPYGFVSLGETFSPALSCLTAFTT